MTCNEARQHWNLYHDSEGDAQLHFQINEHLGNCADCTKWFAQQSRLENLIEEKLASSPATPDLWNKILVQSGLKSPAPARNWLLLAAMAACIGLVVAAASWFAFWHGSDRGADLARLTAEWHEKMVDGDVPVAFASVSDLEVEDYLRKQVSFPVRCPPRKDSGFAVQGAGTCKLAQQPAAYLLGKVERAPVSIFVLPKQSLTLFPSEQVAMRSPGHHQRRQGNYQMIMGVIDRNVVVVIGQASPQQLKRVLNAYGTYPHHDS